jgi:hypothetical protein
MEKEEVPLPNLFEDKPASQEEMSAFIKQMQMQFMMFGAVGLMKHITTQQGQTFEFPPSLTDEEKEMINTFVETLVNEEGLFESR